MVGAPQYGDRRPGPALIAARRRDALANHDFVFIHIPKTGGTSIRAALGMASVPYHLTARDMWQIYPASRSKFSFALVRNPWDRIVSYAHSLPVGVDWDQPTKFDRLDLIPQVDFILDDAGKPLVDFIGRYETLADDFATICGHIGIPTPPLPHLNRSAHRQYRDYYNDADKQFIAETYADDIAQFDYSF
jgi:hypothetical protein